DFEPVGHREAVYRIVEKIRAAHRRRRREQGRQAAAVEQRHKRDRQQIEKDRMARAEAGKLAVEQDGRDGRDNRKCHDEGNNPLHDTHANSPQETPRPFGPFLAVTIAEAAFMEQVYSTTILTWLPALSLSPASRPLSTRKRSAARSVTAMRLA